MKRILEKPEGIAHNFAVTQIHNVALFFLCRKPSWYERNIRKNFFKILLGGMSSNIWNYINPLKTAVFFKIVVLHNYVY